MTFKLYSLARWDALAPGEAVVLTNPAGNGERRVRLNVNVERETTFYVENEDGPRLLGTIPAGLETFEFSIFGDVAVFAKEGSGEVHYQTSETEPTHVVVVDPVIFTKIANRRHRNPELEELMHRMQLNVERRLAQQAVELEAAMLRRQKESEYGRSVEVIKTDAPGAAANHREGPIQFEEPPTSAAVKNTGQDSGVKPTGSEPDGAPKAKPAPEN